VHKGARTPHNPPPQLTSCAATKHVGATSNFPNAAATRSSGRVQPMPKTAWLSSTLRSLLLLAPSSVWLFFYGRFEPTAAHRLIQGISLELELRGDLANRLTFVESALHPLQYFRSQHSRPPTPWPCIKSFDPVCPEFLDITFEANGADAKSSGNFRL